MELQSNTAHVKGLVDVISTLENFEEAGAALLELESASPSLAKKLAHAIFNEKKGDVYLQALAFEVFYSLAPLEAVEYIEQNALMVDRYLLQSMLSLVAEDVGRLETYGHVKKAVLSLKDALAARADQEGNEKFAETVDWFRRTYP